MKKLLVILMALSLSGCSLIPKAFEPQTESQNESTDSNSHKDSEPGGESIDYQTEFRHKMAQYKSASSLTLSIKLAEPIPENFTIATLLEVDGNKSRAIVDTYNNLSGSFELTNEIYYEYVPSTGKTEFFGSYKGGAFSHSQYDGNMAMKVEELSPVMNKISNNNVYTYEDGEYYFPDYNEPIDEGSTDRIYYTNIRMSFTETAYDGTKITLLYTSETPDMKLHYQMDFYKFNQTTVTMPGETDPGVTFPTGPLSREQVLGIVSRAVEREKTAAIKSEVSNDPNMGSLEVLYYRGGYRSYTNYLISPPNSHYDVVSYVTPDYSEVYYASRTDSNPYGSVSTYSTPDYNDQFIYAYGYGQIGISAAAFVACQSMIGYQNNTRYSTSNAQAYYNASGDYVLEFTAYRIDDCFFRWEMTLDENGGMTYLRYGFNTTELSETGIRTYFGERYDAPAEIVNVFKDYVQ